MNNENPNSFSEKLKNINNTADSTASLDPKDIEANKGLSVLSYIGPLVFVPMFARKDSKYARFHATQGLTLFIINAAYTVIQIILTVILRMAFPWRWTYGFYGGRGPIYTILTILISLVWIPIAVLVILGIINAVTGKAKELPIIGKIKLLK